MVMSLKHSADYVRVLANHFQEFSVMGWVVPMRRAVFLECARWYVGYDINLKKRSLTKI